MNKELTPEQLDYVKRMQVCPKCLSNTNTFRHPFAKVWCPMCGYVLREEGDRRDYDRP